MSEEAQVEEQETKSENGEEVSEKAKKGTEFVDIVDPKLQARFNRLYGHVKQSERTQEELAKMNRALMEKLEQIEGKVNGQEVSRQVADLMAKKRAALEDGDHDKVMELDERIYQARRDAEKPAPKEKPKDEPEGQFREFQFTPEQQRAINAWSQETTEDGARKRPWADPGHPRHQRLLKVADGVMADPDFAGASIQEALAEVDRLMGSAKQEKRSAAVLSSDGNARAKSKKIELRPEQKIAAQKMGVSEKKYIEVLEMMR